ncbi:Hypothetical protein CAP_1265 [Chondromyces apiculatus DSM 436]|uniref:Uncharacterized protein n=1 Tax=Chondromyces apiculatus DSM 436 TaxID=1192034 RepID=A0A017TEJ0_9BACT|nr:Hypothetical protein CAP_1265 [Chondromyces apiculatus DSM 436]
MCAAFVHQNVPLLRDALPTEGGAACARHRGDETPPGRRREMRPRPAQVD